MAKKAATATNTPPSEVGAPPAGIDAGWAVAGTVEFMAGKPGPGIRLGDSGLEPIVTVEAPAATHLHICARVDGFRRCGRAWPAAGVVVPMADFSADDLSRLRAEPELIVVEVAP